MARKDGPLTGAQKVAMLLVALGPDVASAVMKNLGDEEVEKITLEIARLEDVGADKRDETLREFVALLEAEAYTQKGGMGFAKDLLTATLGEKKAQELLDRLSKKGDRRPFAFTKTIEPETLFNLIRREHPQTIAMILANIEPEKAANILNRFESEMQGDIAKKIAGMDKIVPEAVKEVERILEKKLASVAESSYTQAGGVDALVDLLNNMGQSAERHIIESLEADDPELAENVRNRLFVFDDIVLLDDKGIRAVLGEVAKDDLVKALKAANEDVKDKVFKNLSKRASSALQEDIEYIGPVRKSEAEEAQARIIAIVRRLEEDGAIIVMRRGNADEYVIGGF